MEREEKLILYKKLINASAIFASLVAFVLLMNFFQMKKQDPIESGVIAALVERLDQDPNNEALKEEIRQLDLLARKAYFTSVWQVKTGAFILLFAAIFLGIIIKLRSDLMSTIEEPTGAEESHKLTRRRATRWIWAVGSVILIGSLASALWTNNQLANYDEFKIAQKQANDLAAAKEAEGIQVIDLSSADVQSVDSEVENDLSGGNNQSLPQEVIENTDGIQESELLNRGDQESQNTESQNTTERASESQSVQTQKTGSEALERNQVTTAASPGSLASASANHYAFRGPFSNGNSSAKNIPTDWDVAGGKNLIWKVQVPREGFNSPVIWGDKLFVCGADNAVREVYCYNSNTGELLWQKKADNIPGSPATPPKTTADTGLSAPTATTNGKGVFAMFGTGDIIAFDMNGNRLWAKNMGVPDNHYGHSSSLLCQDNKLIVLFDTNRGGKIWALNTNTGEVIWEQVRKNKISWSSPILAKINDKFQIITTTDPYISAHDLETGEELWSVECLMGEVGASACYGQGLVFGANEYARLVAIKPGANPEIVWENDEYLPEVASPVESQGLLFIATSYGVFACYNALTGEKFWEHECNDGYYASPVIADGKVYAIDMSGVMHIFAVSKELKVIGEPKLGENAMASPAFAEGKIYLRGEKSLFCIGKK
jgi:outer membrane protein assembly factor BamB